MLEEAGCFMLAFHQPPERDIPVCMLHGDCMMWLFVCCMIPVCLLHVIM